MLLLTVINYMDLIVFRCNLYKEAHTKDLLESSEIYFSAVQIDKW